MSLARSRAVGAYAIPATAGTKRSRKCPTCNAGPGTSCWRLRPGKNPDDVPRVPLQRQNTYHPDR